MPDAEKFESHSCAEATGGDSIAECGPQESTGDGSRYEDRFEQDEFQMPKYECGRLVREVSRDGLA